MRPSSSVVSVNELTVSGVVNDVDNTGEWIVLKVAVTLMKSQLLVKNKFTYSSHRQCSYPCN